MDGLSKDMENSEMEKLRAVFPDCFVEGRLDIDKLLNLCGQYIDDDFEKYEFKWKGKGDCLKLAQKRSTATLRPCPEESVNFVTSQNLYIEGDNLEVLKILQASYYRQIKMIYIDPPYNTGHDFIYEDDFKDTLARYREVTSQTTKSNPESMGRFHTNWLNMMYPRLRLAANLLRDDGVIFISIDDTELHNLRKLCDEVFGEEHFVGTILWKKKTNGNNMGFIPPVHDYILAYKKMDLNEETFGFPVSQKYLNKTYKNPDNDPRGPWTTSDLSANHEGPHFKIVNPVTGQEFFPPSGRYWVFNEQEVKQRILDGRVIFGKTGNSAPVQKKFLSERQNKRSKAESWWDKHGMNEDGSSELTEILGAAKVFNHPKPSTTIKHLCNIATQPDSDDIVLDFFSGSAATAHALMRLNAEDGGNRRFIMVQLPELCEENTEAAKAGYKTICEIGKERIRRAGQKIQAELAKGEPELNFEDKPKASPDTGFKVFKLDTSNLKTWDTSPVSGDQLHLLEERLNSMIDRVKPDRGDLDMVYEIMLKQGLQLTELVTSLDIEDHTVYSVREDSLLLICLEKNVSIEAVEQMANLVAPARIIFGQDCFADVTAMSNVRLSLKDSGINFKFF